MLPHAEPTTGYPGGLTAEELALVQQALASGRVDSLPLRLQEALEDNPLLAAQVLENAQRLEALPTHLFDATGLLNSEGIAIAVDALRRKTAHELHPAILAHLEASQESAARVADATLEIRNAELERDRSQDQGGNSRVRPIGGAWFRWGAAVALVAASLALLVVVGAQWLFSPSGSEPGAATLADAPTEHNAAPAPPREESASPSLAPLATTEQAGTHTPSPAPPPQAVPPQGNLFAPLVRTERPQQTVQEVLQQNAPLLESGLATTQTATSLDALTAAADIATPENWAAESESAPSSSPTLATADDARGNAGADLAPSATRAARSESRTNRMRQGQQGAAPQQAAPGAPEAAAGRMYTAYGALSNPPSHDFITRIYFKYPMNRRYLPLQTAILEAWRAGQVAGIDYHNPASRITHAQLQASIGGRIATPDPVIELVERGQQRGHPNVVYVKIRWGGPSGYSVAFAMTDRQFLQVLQQTKLPNPANEASELSALQLLELRAFQGQPAYGPHDELLPD